MDRYKPSLKNPFPGSIISLLLCGLLLYQTATCTEIAPQAQNRMLASTTHSMGHILGTVSSHAYSIVLSSDGKTAFVSTVPNGSIQVIDVSDLESPRILSTLQLTQSRSKAVELSLDGKTLYMSDFFTLEIIDVSNLDAPVLIGSFINKDPLDSLNEYRPSLAVSADSNTVFTAGYGFRVFDVSDPTKPTLISSKVTALTGLAASNDRKTLYLAYEILSIYDMLSDPNSLSLLNTFETKGDAFSVVISSDSRTLYMASLGDNAWSYLHEYEVLDVSKPTDPIRKDTFSRPFILSQEIIFAVSPDDRYLFTRARGAYHVVKMIDLKTKDSEPNVPKIIKGAVSVVFSRDQRIVFVTNEFQVVTFRLFLDLHNRRVLSPQENFIASIHDYSYSMFILSSKGSIAFLIGKDEFEDYSSLQIVDISKKNAWKSLSSTTLKSTARFLSISQNEDIAFITHDDEVEVYDISNFDSLQKIGTFGVKSPIFSGFSLGGETSFLMESTSSTECGLRITDISNLDRTEELFFLPISHQEWAYPKTLLSKDANTLFLAKADLSIYDLSDPKDPTLLSKTSLSNDEGGKKTPSIVISSDQTLLFAFFRESKLEKLKIFNIKDLKLPVLLSTTILPSRVHEEEMAVTSDGQLLYITNDDPSGGLMVIDVENPLSPVILGLMHRKGVNDIHQLELSSDNKVAFALNALGTLNAISLLPKYSLYTHLDKFTLGTKQSTNFAVLKLDPEQKYTTMDQNYKILKVSLYESEVSPAEQVLVISHPPLPNWMHFDSDSNMLTLEPKWSNHIGLYNLFGVISTAVPMDAFRGIGSTKTETDSKDLITVLIGVGYLDNERFLTLGYDFNQDLLLPSNYSSFADEISRILYKYRYTTVTQIQVQSSLQVLTDSEKIFIRTPNTNFINVAIKLENSHATALALFVSKTYSAVHTSISDKRSLLIIEGSLPDINRALKDIVIDLSEPDVSVDGSVTVSDGMNPPLTRDFQGISSYFELNEAPELKKDIQEQMDKIPVYTGDYFIIELDPESFSDTHEGILEYSITMPNDQSELPGWLNLRGLVLTGTPPEQWKSLSYDLILVVKNEFKSIRVPFTLNVRVSFLYALKLIATYSGYLVTLIGLWFSINKLYNIFGKKYYIHPKKFLVEVDEPITTKTIYPIGFIAEEIRECKFILTKLEEFIPREEKRKSLEEEKLVTYFLDNSTGQVNKPHTFQVIDSIVDELPAEEKKRKLALYLPGMNSRREMINQLIVNELVMKQIRFEGEKPTKEIFEKIKKKWVKLIEIDESSKFTINRTKLLEELEALGINISEFSLRNVSELSIDKSIEKPFTFENEDSHHSRPKTRSLEKELMNYGPDPKINFSLLEDALIAHGMNYQNFNLNVANIRIFSKQRSSAPSRLSKLREFLKLNLWHIDFNDKGRVGYDVRYKMEDNTLIFYGIPHRNLKGKTLVVQITEKQGRILRELWLYGMSRKEGDEDLLLKDDEDVL